MSQILTCLYFDTDTFHQVENLLGLMADYNGKHPNGHLLLVASPDTHPEMQEKAKISAEVAFETVSVLAVPWPIKNGQSSSPVVQMNHCFRHAAAMIAERYAWPWLWLEADCVPLNPNWLELIRDEYNSQPHRYCGPWMRSAEGQISMGRCGVYPTNAILQLASFFDQPAPFELQAGQVTIQRCTKSNLFQVMRYTAQTERSAVKPNAAILHGDKEGVLLSAVREDWKNRPTLPVRAFATVAMPANSTGKDAPIKMPDELIHDPLTQTTSLGDVTVPAEKPRRGRPPTPKPASLTVNA